MGDYSIYIDNINKIVSNDQIHRVALNTMLVEHKTRIFSSGLDANGTKIGTYSKKKGSYGGKTYQDGYSGFKASIGRNPGFVILRLTDQMYVGYGVLVVTPGKEYGIGHQNQLDFNKSQWMETKYGKKIFFASVKEKNILVDTLNAQINRINKA